MEFETQIYNEDDNVWHTVEACETHRAAESLALALIRQHERVRIILIITEC